MSEITLPKSNFIHVFKLVLLRQGAELPVVCRAPVAPDCHFATFSDLQDLVALKINILDISVGTMGAVGAAAPTIIWQWVQAMYSAPTIIWNKIPFSR